MTRILLIGQGIFLDGLRHILGEQAQVEIVGAVGSWDAACEALARQHPNIVIVDHANAELRAADLSPLLENNFSTLKVIYLTLADRKMVIHDRKQISDAGLPDLLAALHLPGFEGGSQS